MGPIARTSSCFGIVPCTMKPPIMTAAPVRTMPRVEMLIGAHGAASSQSYASTSATPVVPFAPRTMAVYAPGASDMEITDSLACGSVRPRLVCHAWMLAAWSQLSFVAMICPLASCNSSVGSASAPATPCADSDGPSARTSTCLLPVPCTMKPAMPTLSPVSTCRRVEMFPRLATPVAAASGSGARRTVPASSRERRREFIGGGRKM